MNNISTNILTLCFVFGISSSVLAEKIDGATIARQGNGKGAVACIACHGQQGEGNASAGYPYLAGLPAGYLSSQLHAFSHDKRQNAVMKPIASKLTDDEITAVANYYASLKSPQITKTAVASSSGYPDGERLATRGKWSAGMPACFQCHGEQGRGIAPHFPPIAGQPFAYIKNQLLDWQSGKRQNDPIGLMQAVAKSLDQQEIEEVAHYLSAQNK